MIMIWSYAMRVVYVVAIIIIIKIEMQHAVEP
jgi:hypothetical protein